MNRLAPEKQDSVIAHLCEGMSIRGTERLVNVDMNTIMTLGRDVGEGCFYIHDEMFRDLHCNVIEMDEAWSYIHTKQGHLEKGDPKEYGDQYSYVALDSESKAIVSYLVGKRNDETTASFAMDLRSRVKGRPQISSDGFQPYVKAVALAFGKKGVDYAMLIKSYSAECSVEAKRRYSPNRVTGTEKEIIYGDPDIGLVSTSYVERQNLTIRMLMRRFTRLTNAFSKKLRNHAAAFDLYVAYYNLCRGHESLKGRTPAMALGVEDHKWTVDELVTEALEWCGEDEPVRLGSQRYAQIVCESGRCFARRARK